MTTPTVFTTVFTIGLVSVVPWITSIAVVSVGGSTGSGSGSGSGSAALSPAALVGVGAAVVKSAELTSVSREPVRLSEVVTDAAVAAVVSKVFELP